MLQKLLQLPEWWFPRRRECQWIHHAAGGDLGTHLIQERRKHSPTRSEIIGHWQWCQIRQSGIHHLSSLWFHFAAGRDLECFELDGSSLVSRSSS